MKTWVKHFNGFVIVKTLNNTFNVYKKEQWENGDKPLKTMKTVHECIDYITDVFNFFYDIEVCKHENNGHIEISGSNEKIKVCFDCGVEM